MSFWENIVMLAVAGLIVFFGHREADNLFNLLLWVNFSGWFVAALCSLEI